MAAGAWGRLVVLDLGRRDQDGEDDPRLPPVDHVMVVIPQMRPSSPARHRGGVGIGRADAKVGRPSIRTPRGGAVRAAGLADPIVTGSGVLG